MWLYRICLSLTYFTQHNALKVHPGHCRWWSFFHFMAAWCSPVCVCVCAHTTSSLSIIRWWIPVGSTSRLLHTGCNEHGGWWGSFLESDFVSFRWARADLALLCFGVAVSLTACGPAAAPLRVALSGHRCPSAFVCLYCILGMLAVSRLHYYRTYYGDSDWWSLMWLL